MSKEGKNILSNQEIDDLQKNNRIEMKTIIEVENNHDDGKRNSYLGKQNRIAFTRKQKKSKMGEFLILENEKGYISTPNFFKFKKAETKKLEQMNDILEEQKQYTKNKCVYEILCDIFNENIINNDGISEKYFDEQEKYPEESLNTQNKNLINSCFIEVIEMNNIEKAFVDLKRSQNHPLRGYLRKLFLNFRKYFYYRFIKFMKKINRKISKLCYIIIKNPMFEIVATIIIIVNSITIIIDKSDPRAAIIENPIITGLNSFFFCFYIFEVTTKIFALGLIKNEGAYLNDNWNKFDFFIISMAIVNQILSKYEINLPTIRAFRVIRPLKIISSFKDMQSLLESLILALPLLLHAFLILFFCYLLYALAGLQLFSGLLKKRCIVEYTGLLTGENDLCGNYLCGENQICGKLLKNPNFGIVNFDNIFYSLLNVFQIVTMNNWSFIMYSVQKTFTNYISVYFISLVTIGGFFLVNLTLAIVKFKFSSFKMISSQNKKREKIKFDFLLLKKNNVWIPRKKNCLMNLKHADKSQNKKKHLNSISVFPLDIKKISSKIINSFDFRKSTKIRKINTVQFFDNKHSQRRTSLNLREENIFENLNPKYLKLQINSKKKYESSSQNDVLMKITEKIYIKKILKMKDRTKFMIKKKSPLFYVPRKIKNMNSDIKNIRKMKIALFQKERILFVTKLIAKVVPVYIKENALKYRCEKKKNPVQKKKENKDDLLQIKQNFCYEKLVEEINTDFKDEINNEERNFNNELDFIDLKVEKIF